MKPSHGGTEASPGSKLSTESLRKQVLADRVPVLSIADERTWRSLVEQGRHHEAAGFQASKAREFVQENAVIGRMSHSELVRYADGDRRQQLDAVRQAVARLQSEPRVTEQPVRNGRTIGHRPGELDR